MSYRWQIAAMRLSVSSCGSSPFQYQTFVCWVGLMPRSGRSLAMAIASTSASDDLPSEPGATVQLTNLRM